MAEYIEREAAIKEFNLYFGGVSHAVIAKQLLDSIPAADVGEIRHGEWLVYESDKPHGPYDSKEWYKCSVCGEDAHGRCVDDEWYSYPILSDFCSNCGARMNGKDEEDG